MWIDPWALHGLSAGAYCDAVSSVVGLGVPRGLAVGVPAVALIYTLLRLLGARGLLPFLAGCAGFAAAVGLVVLELRTGRIAGCLATSPLALRWSALAVAAVAVLETLTYARRHAASHPEACRGPRQDRIAARLAALSSGSGRS